MRIFNGVLLTLIDKAHGSEPINWEDQCMKILKLWHVTA